MYDQIFWGLLMSLAMLVFIIAMFFGSFSHTANVILFGCVVLGYLGTLRTARELREKTGPSM